jgi:hypothetical protein
MAGCYTPHHADCAIACGAAQQCPDGYHCIATMCRPLAETQACNGSIDAGPADAVNDASPCWSPPSTNFDSCTLMPTAQGEIITTNATINTDNATIALGPAGTPSPYGTLVADGMARKILFVHDAAYTVMPNAYVKVIGHNGLLIAADGDISIAGTIDAIGATSHVDADCPALTSLMNTDPGAGGPGGGFGGLGGRGGDSTTEQAAGPMQPNGMVTLSPLRPGCPGVQGGGLAASGGGGGAAGGAVQLASNKSITVSGSIVASGNGGTSGAATSGNSGGGGGGSGGAILLEAPMIQIMGAKICAAGGGGGQGAGNNIAPTVDGGRGACNGGAGANDSGTTGGIGGDGAGLTNSTTDGAMGVSGSSGADAGGGGGGSVGRIRIHGPVSGTPAALFPAAYMM